MCAKKSNGCVVMQDKSKPSNLPQEDRMAQYPDMGSAPQYVGDTVETWDGEYADSLSGIKSQKPKRRY